MNRLLIPVPGITFHAPNANNSTLHLTILMAGPDRADQVAVASISTDKGTRATDPACILLPGDHPFIDRRSYVAYTYACFMDLAAIHAGIANRTLKLDDTLEEQVTRRVIEGAMMSKHIPRGIQSFVTSHAPVWM